MNATFMCRIQAPGFHVRRHRWQFFLLTLGAVVRVHARMRRKADG